MKTGSCIIAFAFIATTFAAGVDFYVSTLGSDSNNGDSEHDAFQTLTRAQEAVRNAIANSMSANVTVHIAPGIYTLSVPLTFTTKDSGKNGFTVNWVGANALISGGLRIANWTASSNGVYSARVPVGTKSRNLYVNGQASNYARRKIANRKDITYTDTSMKWTSTAYDWITNLAGIAEAEVRFINSFTDRYAPIRSAGQREIFMEQNTWFNQNWGYDHVSKPNADFGVWVQNDLTLLTEGGQFYLNSTQGKIYYKPLICKNMANIDTYLGILETLLSISGSYDNPVHDIIFKDLSFAHTTWMRPSEIGYVDQQTGGHICENKTYTRSNVESARPWWCQMQSAVQISAANNIHLLGGNYTQIGSGAIGIGNDANAHITGVGLGASNIFVKNGYFAQVMGNSITAGGIRPDSHHPSNQRMLNSHIEISGNIFHNVSSLFNSTVPIFASYLQYSTIAHNDIDIAPYMGICHGYGWGSNDAGGSPEYDKRGLYQYQPKYNTPTISESNLISGNLVHRYGLSHTDLGALYTLSKSPSTVITQNYAFDSTGFGMYTDEGSNSYNISSNILLPDGIWLAQNGVNTANNVISDNYGKVGGARSQNYIISNLSQAPATARKAAYRAGILPAQRTGRPISNPDLPDGDISIVQSGSNVLVIVESFDDAPLINLSLQVTSRDTSLVPVKIPTGIAGNQAATATYQFSGSNRPTVMASAKYFNSRTAALNTVSVTKQIN